MPRFGSEPGLDPVSVFTAYSRGQLRSVPLSRLKGYANAYNIRIDGVLEKGELIDRIVAARTPHGSLSQRNEDYYRKHSIPNRSTNRPRGLFTRAMDAMGSERTNQPPSDPFLNPPYQPRQRTTSQPSVFARPDLNPDYQGQGQGHQQYRQQQQPTPQPSRSQPQSRNTSYSNPNPQPSRPPQQPQYAPPPGPPPAWGYPGYGFPTQAPAPPPTSTRGRSQSTSGTPQPPHPTVPTLDQLVDMDPENISALSISTLMAILSANHVNARLAVEKSELVAKVRTLVEDEKQERAAAIRRAVEEEQEMRARRGEMSGSVDVEDARVEEILDEEAGDQEHRDIPSDGETHAPTDGAPVVPPKEHSPNPSPAKPPPPKPRVPVAERSGLCVICQDEEANIAIVDCGYVVI
ncbi:hypothetical protein NLI96_g3138 [Meripilus lineatus]|uniref:Uncharacterized protein n=1 Tax=Meripilus lineatus TaxID=2056292 RepID=A0AAD5YGW2_9APHY|nr:hypothetical protein NLI96_g3138 [Physisporinus lineatus]